MNKKRFKITFNAPVVLSIVIISSLATALNYITAGKSGIMLFSTYHSPLFSLMTWIRFFTHIFGHANWQHLIGNMTYILLLGPMIEEKYSSRILFEMTAITAFITSIVNYIFFPNIALCGASGVVFSFILLASFTSFREGEIPVSFILVAILFIGQEIYDGLTIRDNISNMAHIIGGIIGGTLGYELNKNSRPVR